MSDDVYRQRRFGVRTSFSFGPEAMTYGLGDWHSFSTQTVPYELLDLTRRSDFTLGNTGYVLRWSWFLLLGVFALQLFGGTSHWFGTALLGMLVVAGLVGAAVAFELTEVRFTEIPTAGADSDGVRRFLRIIREKHHDTILAELEQHWRDRLRNLYGQIDPQADPNREAARFERLRDLSVIDEAEFARALEQLRAIANAPPSLPGDAQLN